jgi:hypothetical protein
VSDYLVNLARRSAGLAPVVRARVAPVAVAGSDSLDGGAIERQVVSRKGAEGAEVATRVVAPGAHASAVVNAAPTIAPVPVTRAASHVAAPAVQRAPVAGATSAAPAAPLAARGGDAPVVAPRAGPRSTESAAIIVPATTAIASAANVALDDTPRSREMQHEPRTIETRTETIVRAESAEAVVPVVVTIEPAERAVTAAPASRAEPAPERTVHVRIGAIEIHAADAAASQQHPVTAAAGTSAPAALPTPSPTGFDEYAALRSYAPWAW